MKPMVTKMHEESLLLVGHVNDCLRWITGMGQPKIDLLVPVFVAAGSGGRSNNPILYVSTVDAKRLVHGRMIR